MKFALYLIASLLLISPIFAKGGHASARHAKLSIGKAVGKFASGTHLHAGGQIISTFHKGKKK